MRVKICGLTRERDIDAVNAVLPDYIGFVFAESRRRVSVERATVLRARLNPGIIPVGVFKDASIDDITSVVRLGIISMAQLHGDEDNVYIEKLKEKLGSNIPVIKAVGMSGCDTSGKDMPGEAVFRNCSEIRWTDSLMDYRCQTRRSDAAMLCALQGVTTKYGDDKTRDIVQVAFEQFLRCPADYLLFDSAGGGTGTPIDWTWLLKLNVSRPFFLAGGLNPQNIREAIGVVCPFAVDTSSGVETDGFKDPLKILEFVRLARIGK